MSGLDDATKRLLAVECLEVQAWSELYGLIAGHPPLLDEAADAFLQELSDVAPQTSDDAAQVEAFQRNVAALRHILARCRETGPADALLATTLETRPAVDPAFATAVHELQAAGERGDQDGVVAAGEAALALVDRVTDPATWAALAEATGSGHARTATGDRAAHLAAAEQLFGAALALYAPQVDPHKTAAAHLALATVAEARGDVDAALGQAQAAADVPGLGGRAPGVWAEAHLEAARLLLVRGGPGRDRDDLAQAAAHGNRALEVFSPEHSPAQWCAAHGHIASALFVTGGDPEAIARHASLALEVVPPDEPQRAAALRAYVEDATHPRGPAFAAVIRRMTAWGSLRDPALLEPVIIDGAAALAADQLAEDPEGMAELKLMLGLAYTFREQGDRAENIEQAIALLEEAAELTTDLDRRAGIADSLGTCFQRRVHGDPSANRERAITHYEQAVAGYEESGDRLQWALAQRNLATAYWNPDNPAWARRVEQAIEHSDLALTVLTADDHPHDWSGVHVNLAAYYAERAEGDRAANLATSIEHCEQALTVRTREAFPADWAQIQLNLAGAHLAAGDGDRAEAAMRSALEVYTPDAHPHECRRLSRQLGNQLFAAADWEGAAAAYGVALEATERLYDAARYRRSRDLELVTSGDLYHRLAYAQARSGAAAAAVGTLELARGRTLRETIGEDAAKLLLLAALDPGALEAYQQARAGIEHLAKWERSADGTAVRQMTEEQLAQFVKTLDVDRSPPMLITKAGADDTEARETMRRVDRAREADTRARYEAAWAELEATLGRIRQIPGLEDFGADPTAADVAAAAATGLPLAYLVCTPAGSVALVARRGDGDGDADAVVEAAWSDYALADLMAGLLGDDGSGGYLGSSVVDLLDVLPPLLDQLGGLTQPLAALLQEGGEERVGLVPMGYLGSLPLHAASWVDGDGRRQSLLDVVDVTYVPSAHALTILWDAAEAAAGQPAVLCGVADPRPAPEPLPYAREELEAAAGRFEATRPFYGEDATRANLLGALEGATHLHLACHGVNDWGNPLFSHFELPDEQLDMRDVRYLHADAFRSVRLAVLSACESAIPGVRLPDEIVGLPSALLLAGVPAAVGTLWQAPDLPTALLMVKFYELLRRGDGVEEPMAPARALSRAQVWLRDATLAELQAVAPAGGDLAAGLDAELGDLGPDERPFQDNPVMWAPFAAFGA